MGRQHALRINAGWLMRLRGNLAFTPTVGISANKIAIQPYEESGAGALALQVNTVTYTRLASQLGGRLVMERHLPGRLRVRPSFHLMWQHEFNRDGYETEAAFVGGGNAFTTPGQPLPGDSLHSGITVSMFTDPSKQLTLQLDGMRGDNYSAIVAQIQWQTLF